MFFFQRCSNRPRISKLFIVALNAMILLLVSCTSQVNQTNSLPASIPDTILTENESTLTPQVTKVGVRIRNRFTDVAGVASFKVESNTNPAVATAVVNSISNVFILNILDVGSTVVKISEVSAPGVAEIKITVKATGAVNLELLNNFSNNSKLSYTLAPINHPNPKVMNANMSATGKRLNMSFTGEAGTTVLTLLESINGKLTGLSGTISISTVVNPLLTVKKDSNGTGTVTSSPAGIDCGSDCMENYIPDTNVTLTATPATGSIFRRWSGCDSNPTKTTCTVKMSAAKDVTATFQERYTLTVTKDGTGTGDVTSSSTGIDCGTDCSQSYLKDTSVTLTAAPDTGSSLSKWTGCDSNPTKATCIVKMSAVKDVVATFDKRYTLTVKKVGTGTGTVTSSPSGINCGLDCDQSYTLSATAKTVTLTATSDSGSSFTKWSGCDNEPTATTCEVTMSAAKDVTASFAKRYTLNVTKAGTGTGTVKSSMAGIDCGSDCRQTYTHGATATSVILTATEAGDSELKSWSGCDSTIGNTCTVSMSAAKNVTATFDQVFYEVTLIFEGAGKMATPVLFDHNDQSLFVLDSFDCSGSAATCTFKNSYPKGSKIAVGGGLVYWRAICNPGWSPKTHAAWPGPLSGPLTLKAGCE